MTTKIIAHRGASSKCPENTMMAFKQAERDGADGIELDLHLTRDRIPVVIHDETVDRTTDGYGFIKDYTVSGLKKLSAGRWKGWKFRNADIPTFEEVLEWIQTTKLLLVIEFKNNLFPYKGLENLTLDLIDRYGMADRTIYSSFNHDSLMKLKKIDQSVETAPLYSKPITDPARYVKSLGASGIHPYYRITTQPLVQMMHNHHFKVRPYTVNAPHIMDALLKWGVDGLITDQPALAHKMRKQQVRPI
ncbi:glycerophosphodiester phosphodiesterase [Camelliibacillus cellulosilyticus]|uniref:Glycerophosphodiester phosphodiesterase n=1 Tax=Camelliibacillus cellulosilyticus TaxID=2174486 RepID=A0ABV9GM16_9BACL